MPLTRQASLQRAAGNAAAPDPGADLALSMSFASEVPYERWWGIEILDCSPSSVRLDRMNDGGPLLYNHDWDDLRGHHKPGSVKADGQSVRGEVIVSHAADNGRTIALIAGGHLAKTSTSYEIHKVIEQTVGKDGRSIGAAREIDGRQFDAILKRCEQTSRGDLQAFRRELDKASGPFERPTDEPVTYRVVDWEILENSLVTVPADASVGIGRSAEHHNRHTPPPEPQQQENHPMPPEQTEQEKAAAAAATRAAEAQRLEQIERAALDKARGEAKTRIEAIDALAKQFESWNVRAMADQAIRQGTASEDFARQLTEHVAKRGKQWDPAIGMSQGEAQRFSIVRAIGAMMSGNWSRAGFEREASEAFAAKAQAAGIQRQAENSFFLPMEVQQRDMTVGTAGAGGNMVETVLRPQDFIDLLRNATLVKALGARTLSGLVGNADITKQTGAATGYWLSTEATAITESQQTIGLLQLRPKVLGAYTEVSRLLLQQSTPDADQFIMEDLAKVLGVALDVAAINVGGSGAPVGILGTGSIGAFTGTSLAVAALLDAQVDVAGANALTSSCAYLTTPTVASLLAQRPRMTGGVDTPLWQGNILDGQVLGFMAKTTNQMPAATAIFGDFSQVIFAEWSALEIAANPFANFPAGITGIRAFLTADVGIRIPGAFSAASTIT